MLVLGLSKLVFPGMNIACLIYMRKPRIKKEGAIYHVCARANRQELIFKNEQFKELLLKVILEAKKKYSFLFRNFCLMDNHVHFDIEPKENIDISRIMQWILSIFARRYNKIFDYKGHVWYDRFKSKIINSLEQYINTFFYIATNPIRAGLVKHPLEYAYNGLTFYKNNKDPGLLDPVFDWLKPLIDKFLAEFVPEQYQKTVPEHSFRDKRPGRPRNKK